VLVFFFFSSRRRHTRFSRDWSSDVCSSDLRGLGLDQQPLGRGLVVERELEREHPGERIERTLPLKQRQLDRAGPTERELASRSRSEERRVGKEGRAGWAPEQEKKKQSSRAS